MFAVRPSVEVVRKRFCGRYSVSCPFYALAKMDLLRFLRKVVARYQVCAVFVGRKEPPALSFGHCASSGVPGRQRYTQ